MHIDRGALEIFQRSYYGKREEKERGTMKPIYCRNCHWTGDLDGEDYTVLGHVEDLETRINPGEIVPAGECPDCGSLLQMGARPIESDPAPTMTIHEAFEVLAHGGCRTGVGAKEYGEAVKVLAEIFDNANKQFFCPQCGGSHFGTGGSHHSMVGNCHSCRGKSFTWPRTDDDKYFRWVITLPANALPNTPKTVTTSGENVYNPDEEDP